MNTGIASDSLYIIEQDLIIRPNNRRGGETLCRLIAFAEWYVRVLPPAVRVRPASWIDALTDRLTGNAAADVSADNSRRRTAQWSGGDRGSGGQRRRKEFDRANFARISICHSYGPRVP